MRTWCVEVYEQSKWFVFHLIDRLKSVINIEIKFDYSLYVLGQFTRFILSAILSCSFFHLLLQIEKNNEKKSPLLRYFLFLTNVFFLIIFHSRTNDFGDFDSVLRWRRKNQFVSFLHLENGKMNDKKSFSMKCFILFIAVVKTPIWLLFSTFFLPWSVQLNVFDSWVL